MHLTFRFDGREYQYDPTGERGPILVPWLDAALMLHILSLRAADATGRPSYFGVGFSGRWRRQEAAMFRLALIRDAAWVCRHAWLLGGFGQPDVAVEMSGQRTIAEAVPVYVSGLRWRARQLPRLRGRLAAWTAASAISRFAERVVDAMQVALVATHPHPGVRAMAPGLVHLPNVQFPTPQAPLPAELLAELLASEDGDVRRWALRAVGAQAGAQHDVAA